jgi:hypothetical protein
MITESAGRINHYMNDLKFYVKMEHHSNITRIDINHVITSAVSLSSNLIKQSTQRFFTVFDTDLPEVTGNYQKWNRYS